MKFLVILLGAVTIAAFVQDTSAIQCRTGFVSDGCSHCICERGTGIVYNCGYNLAVLCQEGEEKVNEKGAKCECSFSRWYCDMDPPKNQIVHTNGTYVY